MLLVRKKIGSAHGISKLTNPLPKMTIHTHTVHSHIKTANTSPTPKRSYSQGETPPVDLSSRLEREKRKMGDIPLPEEPPKPLIVTDINEPSSRVKYVLSKITELTFIEIIHLVKELETILGPTNVSSPLHHDTASPASSSPSTAAAPATPPPESPKPKTVNVKIISYGELAKIKIMKALRSLKPGLSVNDARSLMEGPPKIVASDIDPEEANKWISALKDAGATVELA